MCEAKSISKGKIDRLIGVLERLIEVAEDALKARSRSNLPPEPPTPAVT